MSDEDRLMGEDTNGDAEELPATLQAAIIRRREVDQGQDPNRRFVDSITLRETSRLGITASHSEIIDQRTGEIHHHAVKIESLRKQPAGQGGRWLVAGPRTIWIDDDNGDDEISRLRDFLTVVRGQIPPQAGDYLIVRLEQGRDQLNALQELMQVASASGKAQALVQSIQAVSGDPDALERLAQFAADNRQAAEIATATLNIARYSQALGELERLIDANALEGDFQRHLSDNHWLFGTEYTELLDLRRATRDEQQDFIVRRTTDNYIEIVEIKTPLDGQQLFNFDQSHDSYYSSAPLARVVGQVIKYIEKLESNRYMLLQEDGLDTNKIRVKIVIGRNGDQNQQEALRNYNGHLHRIEILTFDQLLNIGRRTLAHLEAVIEQPAVALIDNQPEGEQVDTPF